MDCLHLVALLGLDKRAFTVCVINGEAADNPPLR